MTRAARGKRKAAVLAEIEALCAAIDGVNTWSIQIERVAAAVTHLAYVSYFPPGDWFASAGTGLVAHVVVNGCATHDQAARALAAALRELVPAMARGRRRK